MSYTVEFMPDGHLRIPAQVVNEHFRWGHTRLQIADDSITLLPCSPEAYDALLLKQRNLAGDRSVMLAEFLGYNVPTGVKDAVWDAQLRQLKIKLG